MAALAPGMPKFVRRLRVLRMTLEDPESYLRDERQIIDDKPLQLVS